MNILKQALIFLFVTAVSSAIGQTIGPPAGGGGVCGSTTQVQYNNSGACGANSNFVFSPTGGSGSQPLLTVSNNDGPTDKFIKIDGGLGVSIKQFDFRVQDAGGNESTTYGSGTNGIGMKSTMKVQWGGATGNWYDTIDTGIGKNAAGVVEINNGTLGTYRDLIVRTMTANGLASDATHTDATVCVDSSSGLFYKGSGTLGICLGTSSARFKQDIKPLDRGLKLVAALKPKSFFYKPGYGDDGAKEQFGFIAEDVVDADGKLVGRDKDDKPSSVDMVAMIPVLVKAMQEQQAVIDCLRGGGKKC